MFSFVNWVSWFLLICYFLSVYISYVVLAGESHLRNLLTSSSVIWYVHSKRIR